MYCLWCWRCWFSARLIDFLHLRSWMRARQLKCFFRVTIANACCQNLISKHAQLLRINANVWQNQFIFDVSVAFESFAQILNTFAKLREVTNASNVNFVTKTRITARKTWLLRSFKLLFAFLLLRVALKTNWRQLWDFEKVIACRFCA